MDVSLGMMTHFEPKFLRRRLVVALFSSAALACKAKPPADGTLAKGGDSPTSIAVSPASATLAPKGTLQLTVATTPPNVTGTIVWSSSDSSVATVSQAGLVTAVQNGSAIIVATIGATSGSDTITVAGSPPPALPPAVVPLPPPGPPPPAAPPPAPAPPPARVLLGAGDIASCGSTSDEATAAIIKKTPGEVFTLGDNAYNNGSPSEYQRCYAPSWGAFKARTHPVPGNHDYGTAGAAGYYNYFGGAAGSPSRGYYSYDLGAWHIIALNSNLPMAAGSAEEKWLRADLQEHRGKTCTLAYWHHPRFSSGAEHGNDPATGPLWQALYDFNAEIVLVGHDHIYERFAPQTPSGAADPVRGIREFIVGTGGVSHYALGVRRPNSQVVNTSTFGVLKLTLSDAGYAWKFLPVAGASFTDAGTGTCH